MNKVINRVIGLTMALTISIIGTFAIEVNAKAHHLSAEEIEAIPYIDVEIPIEIQKILWEQCDNYNLDINIMGSLIYEESRFKPDVVNSTSSCKGLTQIHVPSHKKRMERLGVEDIFDPKSNITVACDYLDELLNNHEGDYLAALTDYCGGSKYYAKRVIKRTNELVGNEGGEYDYFNRYCG